MAEVAIDYEAFRRELDLLQEALTALPEIAQGALTAAFEQGLMILQGAAADYPPAPANSGYRRTGTLGRLWVSGSRVVERAAGGGNLIEGRISNAVPYGPLVQDPEEQMRVHQGRWKTTEMILAEHEGEIQALVEEAGGRMIQEVAERAEG